MKKQVYEYGTLNVLQKRYLAQEMPSKNPD
uniref:Uncharacterized protein n=1 Tax=Rhizophora mucronata TaxID=61149 RepID=A0A2P2JEP9_RHIMU